jgi:cytochrome c553
MTMTLRIATLLLALAAAPVAYAADLAAGAAKAKEVCAACHGMDGNAPTPDYPRLAGQHRDYLEKVLRDYKSGARKNAIMKGFAAGLSPRDIENVAAYYHSLPAVLATKY